MSTAVTVVFQAAQESTDRLKRSCINAGESAQSGFMESG